MVFVVGFVSMVVVVAIKKLSGTVVVYNLTSPAPQRSIHDSSLQCIGIVIVVELHDLADSERPNAQPTIRTEIALDSEITWANLSDS